MPELEIGFVDLSWSLMNRKRYRQKVILDLTLNAQF